MVDFSEILQGIAVPFAAKLSCMSASTSSLKLGVIREGKTPPDHRVPLTPKQCQEVQTRWPQVQVVVQTSAIRKYPDADYSNAGIEVREDLSDCDIIVGVKEVPVDMLIPSKTYLFFSHTFKQQPHNAKLLAALLDKKVRLIDYEVIRHQGKRLIGFGRYAGVVGCYNGFRLFGLKHELFELKPAHACHDRKELEEELTKVVLPQSTKIVLTGFGRVGHGAREIMALLPIHEVSAEDFLTSDYDEPVFTHLDTHQYNRRISDGAFDKSEFYAHPERYESCFPQFAHEADMYVACHFYGKGSPYIYTHADTQHPDWRVKVVADVSCDVDGPVASTLRASTIADPFYGYHPADQAETPYDQPEAIAVMAIDNLPCELPFDASEDFGNELIKHVLPLLIEGDRDGILEGATQTDLNGQLTPKFAYLKEYAEGGRAQLKATAE